MEEKTFATSLDPELREMEILKIIGHRIRRAMEEKHITFKELGKRCYLAPNTIVNITKGRQSPRVITMIRIAEELNVDVKWLMDYNDIPSDTFI